MLGKKRTKQKTLQEKTKAFKPKKEKKTTDKNEEEINSEIESQEESESKEPKNKISEAKKDQYYSNKLESYDQKRLRMAKAFLEKLDNKPLSDDESSKSLFAKDESESDNERMLNQKIKEKYYEETKQKGINFFSLENFSPYEYAFLKGHKSSITDLCINKQGTLILSASKDCRGILFDVNKGAKTLLNKFSSKALNCVAFSNDEKTCFYGGKDKHIYHIDLRSNKLIQKIRAHNEAVTGILVDANKPQFYSIGNDHVLKVFGTDTVPSILLETFYGHTSKVSCIRDVPGELSKKITVASDNYINLWKIDAMSFLQYNISDLYASDCVACLNNNVFFSGNFNGSISQWRTNKKKPVLVRDYLHGYIENFEVKHHFYSNNFDFQGYKTFTHETIRTYDPVVHVGKPILSLEAPAFSDLLMSGSTDGEINFYEAESDTFQKKSALQISGKGCVNAIKYSQKGNYIAVGNGCDGRLGRWFTEYDAKIGVTIIKLLK